MINKIISGIAGVAWVAFIVLFIHWLFTITDGSFLSGKLEYISGWWWFGCLLIGTFFSNFEAKN